MKGNNKYFAFISYKRGGVDENIANWIHSKLEKYPYPVELVQSENRPYHDTLIRPVFLDTKDLKVTSKDFTDEIKFALENSKYLLVVCSENSVTSDYVNREVQYFLHTHDNDYSRILPIFVDRVGDNLPKELVGSDILSRNCPIYNTFLSSTNEINLYCFYHIVSFLIKVDFRDIYNRYKQYSERKRRNARWLRYGINTLSLLTILFMAFSIISGHRLIEAQSDIVELEKEIFPYSVVTGYTSNFLLPVVDYFEKSEPDAHIFVHMPTRVEDITDRHKYRFDYITAFIEKRLSLDSISQVRLKTSMPRGSNVHKMYSSINPHLNHNYIDFATTTSTFLEIAKMKREHPSYADCDLDDMIEEYTEIFIRQAKEILSEDTVRVSFVRHLSEIESYMQDGD